MLDLEYERARPPERKRSENFAHVFAQFAGLSLSLSFSNSNKSEWIA